MTFRPTSALIPAFALLFYLILGQTSLSEDFELASGADLVGQWVSEPSLGQLGWTQTTISFQEGGVYSNKLDMISFCDGRDRGIDCEYFWMITEGDYSVEGNVVTIKIIKDRKVILVTGQTKPEISESSEYPRSTKIMIERQGKNLLIRKSPDDEATVFELED